VGRAERRGGRVVVYGSHKERKRLLRVAELVAPKSTNYHYCPFIYDYELVARATYLTGDDGEFGRKQRGVWRKARPCGGRVVRSGCLQE